VKGSSPLQKKLFLLPVTSFDEVVKLGMCEEDGFLGSRTEGGVMLVNAHLFDIGAPRVTWLPAAGCGLSPCYRILASIATGSIAGASWERMYLSQPPIQSKTVAVTVRLGLPDRKGHGYTSIVGSNVTLHIRPGSTEKQFMESYANMIDWTRGEVQLELEEHARFVGTKNNPTNELRSEDWSHDWDRSRILPDELGQSL
jgi:hypothetical protein